MGSPSGRSNSHPTDVSASSTDCARQPAMATAGREPVRVSAWLDERAVEIRAHTSSDDEGALWLLFFQDPHGTPIIATAIDGAMAELDAALLQHIAMIIDDGPWKAVLLVVPRAVGAPLAIDRELLPRIRALTRSTHVIDVVVVGESTYWSASGGDR